MEWMRLAVAIGIGTALWAGLAAVTSAEELFVDVAADTGLDFVHFNGMSGELYFSEMMGSGLALVDYDGDGDLDVYLLQGHMLGDGKSIDDATFPPRHPLPLTDRLYRNDLKIGADGQMVLRFVDVTERSGIRAEGYGMGVASGDIDNDGSVDLYITNAGPNQMFRNRGDGTFIDVTAATGTGDRGWGVSAALLDYDRDGWLDLYVGNYVEYREATDKECVSATGLSDYCGPLSYQPEADRLYRNRGDGSFEDASVPAGIRAERPGSSLGVVAGDFNGDSWLDIYVANDQVPNQLWMNQRDGIFFDEAILAGCGVNEDGQPEASMGLVVGDFNGDGLEDLFMSHLTRETNTLYLNDGTGMFVDSTRDSGLGLPSWKFTGFGLALTDWDLDGRLDLFVANGAVLRIEEQLRAGDPYPLHQPNQLYRQLDGGDFEEVSQGSGKVFELSEVSRGVATGDLDQDGDPDFVVSNNAGPVRLLRNSLDTGRPWATVRLVGEAGGPNLQGSRVGFFRGSEPAIWHRFAGNGSYASANDPRVLVGLGEHDGPITVRVEAGSRIVEWRGVPTRRHLSLWPTAGRSSP